MTVLLQQCLLENLGYDPGRPDGLYGTQTRGALLAFQKDWGLPQSGTADAATLQKLREVFGKGADQKGSRTFWDSIRYFQREEFRCRCPRCGGFPAEPKEKLVRLAEQVRTHFDAPATVSSGVRCPAHNAEVGGVSNSRHLYGQAVDLCIRGHSAREVTAYAASLPGCAYTYAIDENFVHMDVAA